MDLSKLSLLPPKVQGYAKISCHVGNNWKASVEYSQMNNHVPGLFGWFFASFVLAKLATSSLFRVNKKKHF